MSPKRQMFNLRTEAVRASVEIVIAVHGFGCEAASVLISKGLVRGVIFASLLGFIEGFCKGVANVTFGASINNRAAVLKRYVDKETI